MDNIVVDWIFNNSVLFNMQSSTGDVPMQLDDNDNAAF